MFVDYFLPLLRMFLGNPSSELSSSEFLLEARLLKGLLPGAETPSGLATTEAALW